MNEQSSLLPPEDIREESLYCFLCLPNFLSCLCCRFSRVFRLGSDDFEVVSKTCCDRRIEHVNLSEIRDVDYYKNGCCDFKSTITLHTTDRSASVVVITGISDSEAFYEQIKQKWRYHKQPSNSTQITHRRNQ